MHKKNNRPEEAKKIREIMNKNDEVIGHFGKLPITKSYPFPNFEKAPTIVAENCSGEDFLLEGPYAWISAGNHSIRIQKEGSETKIEIWKAGEEDQDPIDHMTLSEE